MCSKLINMKKNSITVLDNGGDTFDRYTIINRKTGDVFGASDNPFAPNGFGMFNHNIADQYWNVAYGYSWRKHINVKAAIKHTVATYLITSECLGDKVKMKDLPKDVLKYIDYILAD